MNSQYFLDTFFDLLNFYSNHSDNKVRIGDFNLKLTDPLMMTYLKEHDFNQFDKKIILALKKKVHVLT